MSALRKDMLKLEKENTRLEGENKKLIGSLSSAQSENKTLSSKLTAARSSAPSENKNAPGSAVKSRVPGVVLPGTAEATKEAQFQKQKMELYSDLTNMIVLGVKKNEDDEDVYDCLQAGRNGSKSTLRIDFDKH
jgi:seryl-tRNA synthetase